jgi:hypothetical protein
MGTRSSERGEENENISFFPLSPFAFQSSCPPSLHKPEILTQRALRAQSGKEKCFSSPHFLPFQDLRVLCALSVKKVFSLFRNFVFFVFFVVKKCLPRVPGRPDSGSGWRKKTSFPVRGRVEAA